MESTEKNTDLIGNTIKCKGCGSALTYNIKSGELKCIHCGTTNSIRSENEAVIIHENDYEKFISENEIPSNLKQKVHVVKCNSCGASTDLKPNVTADNCAFCGSPIVINNATDCEIIKPSYLLPFKIESSEASVRFKKWLKGKIFAPSGIVELAQKKQLQGIYIPYWTFDSHTKTNYTGQKGINRTVFYTTTENGKTVQRSRTVTDWYPCSGYVENLFDDTLVVASTSLPVGYANNLEPWDLQNLVVYDEKYISGFKSEQYQIDLKSGFENGKAKMKVAIESTVRSDIGGDSQRISTMDINYTDIKFKHLLLPIWISGYRYNNKLYTFLVNGRTGEVQGDYPLSIIKVTLAVIFFITLIWLLYTTFGTE
ncbi:MAG: hypothetical protein J0M08_07385 [Bacteroidetes bacterium]|nr:hypothetical protein [Bacteroidota bacterium]